MTENFPQNFEFTKGAKQYFHNCETTKNLHRDFVKILPIWDDGVILNLEKNFGINKTLQLNWKFGNLSPTGFMIGGMYSRQVDDFITKTPLISGQINPSSSASNLSFQYFPMKNLKLSATAQIPAFSSRQESNLSGFVDFMKNDYVLSLGWASPARKLQKYSLGLMKSINKYWSAGMEIDVRCTNKNLKTNVFLCSRFCDDDISMAAKLSSNFFDISFWKYINSNYEVGMRFVNGKYEDFDAKICGQYKSDKAVVRSFIDNNFTVGGSYICILDKNLPEFKTPFAIGFNFLHSIPKSTSMFGVKLIFDPNF